MSCGNMHRATPAVCERPPEHDGAHTGVYLEERYQWKTKEGLKPAPPRDETPAYEHEQLNALEHVFPEHGQACEVWYAGQRIDATFDTVLVVDGAVSAIVVEAQQRRRTIQWRNVVEITTKIESQEQG